MRAREHRPPRKPTSAEPTNNAPPPAVAIRHDLPPWGAHLAVAPGKPDRFNYSNVPRFARSDPVS